MEIVTPIGIGFIINLFIFIISRILKQTNKNSFLICLIAFSTVLLGSLIIGSWLGMGMAVISLGMLIFLILTGVVIPLSTILKSGDEINYHK